MKYGLFFAAAIVAASSCESIWLELSTCLPPQLLQVLQHVPSSRPMLSSDWPENLTTELGKIFSLEVAAEIKRDILWNTACQVFNEGC